MSTLSMDIEVPLREWRPTPRQEEYLAIPDSIFEALYGGAVGGGKSEVLIAYPIAKRWYENPNFHGIIFRRTFPQLEESIIPRALRFYKPFGFHYNAQKHEGAFPSGATIRFSYMDKDSDARDHDTAEYHYAAFDELTHFTAFMYRYLLSRIRSSDPNLPAVVRSASNPGNIGHAWVRQRFIEPFKDGGRRIRDRQTGQSRIFVPSRLSDNPHLTVNDPGYAQRLMLLPEAERKAKIDGDWWVFSGQVFTEFRELKIPDEPENALHVIENRQIPPWWPKILAIDWGYSAMTWAGIAAVAPDGSVEICDERTWKKTSIQTWGAELAQMCQPYDSIVAQVLDPSAWRKLGEEHTIAQQIEQASGMRFEKADNDRIGGKQLIHDFLRWTPRPPRYIPKEGFRQDVFEKILFTQGSQKAGEYQKLFLPEPPERNLPRLRIHRRCRALIKAIQQCEHDIRQPEDIAEFNGDDPVDGVRYLLKKVDAYVSQSKKLFDDNSKREQILHQLSQDGNQTAFYRRMEKLESTKPKTVGVRRPRPVGVRRIAFRRMA